MKRVLVLLSLACLASCSQYSNGITSRAWHDVNSKYNALLIAREDIEVAQEYIRKQNIENYESILPIHIALDSNQLDTAKLYLIDAVKKASIIAEKHSNSKHLDEAYLLISEARILKGEYENAIETLKYLNTVSNSEASKTEALTLMMRAYADLKQFDEVEKIAQLLRERPLTKHNKKSYFLNLAYYKQLQEEIAVSAVLLEDIVKNLKKGEEKARLYYILGQMYDALGHGTQARRCYQLVMKNKPNYDLEFHSKLGLLMNQSLGNNTDMLFSKMLDDRKNQDLTHKIYYKMGETSVKKKEYTSAIKNYQKAISTPESDALTKGMAYYQIGEIYLQQMNDYEKAGMYYDSSVVTTPKEYLSKTDISEKASYLNEFIRYKRTYDLEDSLQRLGSLSPELLDEKIQKQVEKQYAEKYAPKEEKTSEPPSLTPVGKKWRLYDAANLTKEKNEFVRIWGNRALEDHWRRTEKSNTTFVFSETEGKMVEQQIKVPENQVANATPEVDYSKNIREEVKEIKKRIPTTKIQVLASKRKQEEAVFRMGKIYKLKFKDDAKAKETFEQFLKEYPSSTYEAEVLYLLALTEANPQESAYAQRLLQDYPNTTFGRQIRKGAVVMTQDKESQAIEVYAQAFKLYENGDYAGSNQLLEKGLEDFMGSQVEDKMAFLRIQNLAKMGDKEPYIFALMDFERTYPSSDLVPKAKERMAVVK